jgi:hypothetical protein
MEPNSLTAELKTQLEVRTRRPALAKALDIDLTTVTRAYGEARRRGLLEAQIGRGTFVSETTARTAGNIPVQVKIDLSMNLPPQPVEANLDLRIARGLEAIQNESSFSAFLNYQRPGGSDDEREVAAKWLRARVPDASAERLVVYPGNQGVLFNALMSLTSPGDVVLTEALTYPGMKAAAGKAAPAPGRCRNGRGRHPARCVQGGRKAHKPKVVYLIPTLHNPTTVTLGSERRCRRSGIVRNFCPVSSAKVWRWWVMMHSRWEISHRRQFASRSGLRATAPSLRRRCNSLRLARADRLPDRQLDSRAHVPGGGLVQMHRAGASRILSVGARSRGGTADDEQSSGNHAHDASAHGRPGHALAQVWCRRPDHSRDPQRSERPPKDNEAGELDKAEEIVGMVFPANKDAALPLNPGEEALDEPAAHVAAYTKSQ